MLIKSTKKLLDELKIHPSEVSGTLSLFSWHANFVTVNHRKAVLLVHDATRMAVLLYGLKAAEFKKLDSLIVEAIRETLPIYGVSETLADKYIQEAGAVSFAKTDNKSVLAYINQLARILPFYEDKLSLQSFNQMAYNKKNSEYPFSYHNIYTTAQELMAPLMTRFETGKIPMEENTPNTQPAFQFLVRLAMDEFDVWRRIIVPARINFFQLHIVLQNCFNWLGYHAYDFRVFDNSEQGEQVAIICDDEEMVDFEDNVHKEKTALKTFLPKYRRVLYSYDYGDGWLHYCELEKVVEEYDFDYPTCVDGQGDAPPDDVGGEDGYAHFLKAIKDKAHPDHADMMEWGKMQRFTHFDKDKVNKKLRNSLKKR